MGILKIENVKENFNVIKSSKCKFSKIFKKVKLSLENTYKQN